MEIPGALLLAMSLFGLGAAGIVAFLAARRGRPSAARSIAAIGAAWLAAYAALLVITSLASRERTLALGEMKRFCGFYLDCHLGVAVDRVDTLTQIGEVSDALQAGGTFYVVTVRVSSDARRTPLELSQPHAVLVDAEGYSYERVPDAEQRLANAGAAIHLDEWVGPGQSYTRRLVFDVPRGAREPRLHVTEGSPIERVVELAIIGDEDALLHARTLHALEPGTGVSSATARAP
jgi:hypothetical protein